MTPLEMHDLEHEPVPYSRRASTGNRLADQEPRSWKQKPKPTLAGRISKAVKTGSRAVWRNMGLVTAGASLTLSAAALYMASRNGLVSMDCEKDELGFCKYWGGQ